MADYLVVAGTTVQNKAIRPVDLSGLLGRAYRGDNDTLPYVAGQVEFLPWLDQIDTTVEWLINGFWTPAGTYTTDFSDSLDDNIETYRALFCDGWDSAGRVSVALHTGNRTLTGLMQCRRWQPVRTGPAAARVVTRLVVGAGRLVP